MEAAAIKLPKGATERERWARMEERILELERRIALLEKPMEPEKKSRASRS